MPHTPQHRNEPVKRNVLFGAGKFNVSVAPRFEVITGETTINRRDVSSAFSAFQAASKKRRQRFRETRGLFTTGLNLSRLRALSSRR